LLACWLFFIGGRGYFVVSPMLLVEPPNYFDLLVLFIEEAEEIKPYDLFSPFIEEEDEGNPCPFFLVSVLFI
jgi:hypothetical protein